MNNIEIEIIDEKRLPKVFITEEVQTQFTSLANNCDTEIGWLALVERQENNFYIYKLIMCEQSAHQTTCELDENALQNIAQKLLQENKIKEYNDVRCWGHSHVNMPTAPSIQDDETFREYIKECNDYFIRIIINKKGEYNLALADMESGFIYKHLTLFPIYEKETKELQKNKMELLEKVKELEEKIDEITEEKTKKIDEEIKKVIPLYVKKKTYNAYNYKNYTNNNVNSWANYNGYSNYYDDDDDFDLVMDYSTQAELQRLQINIKEYGRTKSTYIKSVLNTLEIYDIAETEDVKDIEMEYRDYKEFIDYKSKDWKELQDVSKRWIKEYNYVMGYYDEEMKKGK